jgi:two-component system, NtrC family, sensor histidine kinase KinB
VLILDAQGQVLNLNHAAGALLRLPAGEGAGRELGELEPALRERLAAVRAHVLGGRGAFTPRGFEEAVRVRLPEGPRHFLPRATALYSDEGAVAGVSIVLQDVTRLMRFDELKNDLVATVAHEFRTPLTSLHMAIHLTAEEAAGPLTERQADLMSAARQDCERLQGIVNDLLDLSRMQAGRIELNPQPQDARAILAQAAAAGRPAAEAAGVELRVAAPDEPVPVLADADRLLIVLANLVANAVRHTPAGGRIAASVAPAPGGGARFQVADTGEGIPEQFRERIFERYFQVPGSRRGGVGLGLYISREIVRAHGGEMGVLGAGGGGSAFWFTLPAAARA